MLVNVHLFLFSLGLTCDVCALQVLNCEILSGRKNKRCAVGFSVTLPFVNINCHIYPFVIKLCYLLATDKTVFIKNLSFYKYVHL